MAPEELSFVEDKAQRLLQYQLCKAPSLPLSNTHRRRLLLQDRLEGLTEADTTATVPPDVLGERSPSFEATLFGPVAGTELALVQLLGALTRCASRDRQVGLFFFPSVHRAPCSVMRCCATLAWLGDGGLQAA